VKELQDGIEKSTVRKLNYNIRRNTGTMTFQELRIFRLKYRKMMFLKLNSLFLYAENSYAVWQKERYQATLDDYFSFMEEFPESKYSKEVKKIYQETAAYLKLDDAASLENIQ
jgi:hypothetical protein